MTRQVVKVEGKRFVLIPEDELKQLERRAANAPANDANGLTDRPVLPPADAQGNRPAVEFARASIALGIIRDRQAAGLSQQQLADLAGVRQETISRIESGKHSPTVRTVEKIDRALERALRPSRQAVKAKK